MKKINSGRQLELWLDPTLVQRQFAGRALCIVIAIPLTVALLAPFALQATRML